MTQDRISKLKQLGFVFCPRRGGDSNTAVAAKSKPADTHTKAAPVTASSNSSMSGTDEEDEGEEEM